MRYTVVSHLQFLDHDLKRRQYVGLQRLAIIWSSDQDTRIIDIIERAIVEQVLSPVKLFHASEDCLEIVIDKRLSIESWTVFISMWEEPACSAIMEAWTLKAFPEHVLAHSLDAGRIIREYSSKILESQNLGGVDYSPGMFLFDEEWSFNNLDIGCGEAGGSNDEKRFLGEQDDDLPFIVK